MKTFSVPGVNESDVWQLFNVSNFPYYLLKVRTLQNGICGFCQIDDKVNKILYENGHWIAMQNTVAPRSDETGQLFQFVIPTKRCVKSFSELSVEEVVSLSDIIKWLDKQFSISGGVLVIRSGDHKRNAKSMDHMHVNYHVPTGKKKVEVTIAKSEDDLLKKLPILEVFEEMRLLVESGEKDPLSRLSPERQSLVKDKMANFGRC